MNTFSSPHSRQFIYPNHASAVMRVNLSALKHNYQALKQHVGQNCQIAPVVKTNAYGLGATQAVKALQSTGATRFFVATFEEALQLRNTTKNAHIHPLNGLWGEAMEEAVQKEITPVLSSLKQVRKWQDIAHKCACTLPFWLQIDTGLHRLGISFQEAETLHNTPHMLEGLRIEGIMSHLASGYNLSSPYNETQRLNFEKSACFFPKSLKSFANSGGLLNGSQYFYDVARPGRFLYGSTFNTQESLSQNIESVIGLSARILQVQNIKKGDSIGYDQTFFASRDMRIATVSLGYGDGYFQSLSNTAYGMLETFKTPVVGRISMDLTTVDVTHIPPKNLEAATWIDFINKTITIDQLATWAQTNAWEILTHLGKRLHVSYED